MRIDSQERYWTSEVQQSGAVGTSATKTEQTGVSESLGIAHNADGDTVELSPQAVALSQAQQSVIRNIDAEQEVTETARGTSTSDAVSSSKSQFSRAAKPAGPQVGGASPTKSSATTTETSEDEIEKLETEKEELQQQLEQIRKDNTTQQEDNKIKLIENKIRLLDVQIQQLQTTSSSSNG